MYSFKKKFLLILLAILFNQRKSSFLFSVIISIYNTGRYLDDSIGSLINQTIGYEKIQIILINDGSTDNSEKICLKYKELYKNNIEYIKINHSGVSIARNIGLKYTKGLYINFLDSDDKWDIKAFYYVHLFFKINKNINLVGCRLKYFELLNRYHFLDYKFYKTRQVNLTKEYDCIQLSASSSFFRASEIKGKYFEKGIFSGEDIRFIYNLIIFKPIIGIIKDAIYYYRKRADSSSAMQNTEQNINFYFWTIENVHEYIIHQSIKIHNTILPFIQFFIAYEMLFRIEAKTFKFLGFLNYKRYCKVVEKYIKKVEDKYILEQRIFSPRLKILALSKKYNFDIRKLIFFRNSYLIYDNYLLINLKKYKNLIILKSIQIDNNHLYIMAVDNFWMPRENYFYFCKLGENIYYPNYNYMSKFDYITLFGITMKGRIISFIINLDLNEGQILHFYISYNFMNIEIFPSINKINHLPPIINSYYFTKNFIILNKSNNIALYPFSNNLRDMYEINYIAELRKIKKTKVINLRNKYIDELKKKDKMIETQIWLINDRNNKAGDNGEYFFRFLKKIKPKGIRFYFVIENNCSDYKRLKMYDNIIDLHSKNYINLFFKVDKIISSISESWINNPFDDDGQYLCDLFKFDLIFLQNGIIKDDLSIFMNRVTNKFDLILTTSIREYKSLLSSNYGYDINNLMLTGLPRFDNLLKLRKDIKKEKIIIIFPTWRMNIKGIKNLITKESIKSDNFLNTTYYKFYNKLINNIFLLSSMEKNKYRGIFCLHPNFENEWIYFNKNKIFDIHKNCYQQELFAQASLFVTDYSSLFFDFGYIKTPIIFTHFDYEQYRKFQYSQGYFDYLQDGFGPIFYDIESTINGIISEIENNCKMKKKYLRRIQKFFKFIDDKNCYRTYISIIKPIQFKFNLFNYFIYFFLLILFFIKLMIFI